MIFRFCSPGSRWMVVGVLCAVALWACNSSNDSNDSNDDGAGVAASGGSAAADGGEPAGAGSSRGGVGGREDGGSAGRGNGGSGAAHFSGGASAGGASGADPAAAGAPEGGDGNAGSGGSNEPLGGSSTGGAGGSGGIPLPDGSAEIFARDRLPRFDLYLPEASLATLKSVTSPFDQAQDEYVRASLRYGDETVADVGLRIKGEGSFRAIDQKAAFKIKFDEFVPKQSLHGLRRLVLNNMVEDPSFLAERLAYDLFRAVGLPAPRCNNALVYVNDTFFGVYANVEAEDKGFLGRWFADNGGNLYEEGQKDFVPGAENGFELETNEEVNDRSGLKELIRVVQSAQSATLLEDLSTALDTDQFLRFTAAEAAVNQWDMYAYTVFYPNNFRIYENPADARFVFLPWGMDMSMKPFRDSGRPHIPVFGIARQGDSRGGRVTAGVIFQKCLESPGCKAAYTESVREIADMYEQADLAALAARYYAQIKESVYADPRKEYSNERFEEGYRILLETIDERPGMLRADLEN